MASFQKRGTDSFLLVVEAGYNAKGKRIRRTKTIRIKDKALLKTTKKLRDYLNDELVKFKMEVEAGEYISLDKIQLSSFIEEWKTKFAEKNLAVTTFTSYDSHIRNHIIPHFGHLRMDQIKTIQIINFLDQLTLPEARKDGRDKPLSNRSIADIYLALKSIFKKATEWKVIKENPMEGVPKPKYEKKEMLYYEEEEAQQVIAALYKEHIMWRVYFLGAMIGGMRRGELLALEWTDILFEDGGISVTKNIPIKKNGQHMVKSTKNNKSRIIDMPDWYMDELKKYHHLWKQEKLKTGELWEGGDKQYLFHRGFGIPLYPSTPTTKWRRFVKKHDLKYIRLHDLRHTMVTLLIEAGANMKAIQKRAGHSSLKVTSDTYGHVTKKVSKVTAEQFNKFAPNVNNSSTN
jgi:integrase